MKKAILLLVTLIMTLAIVVPVGVAARSQPQPIEEATAVPIPTMVVKAPEVAGVGQLVTINVYDKFFGDPIPNAGVWAIKVDDLETINGDPNFYVSLLDDEGEFLGWTNGEGNVFHSFNEAGQYVLVAVKDGYAPGFAIIAIKHMLSVKAPEIALVGQQVTISVTERYTSEPVAMAGVWAIDMNDIVVDVEDAEIFTSLAESLGEFLGWTDNTGNVYHAFNEAGRYVLVAVKADYRPGFTRISVVVPALAIKAPEFALVGQEVTITVFEKHIGKPVPGAGVWAVDVNNVTANVQAVEDYAALAEAHGEFLGWTDDNGNVYHKFAQAGRYVLVALKSGCLPGFAKIAIETPVLAIKAPQVALVGQPVTIHVYEKHFNEPVPQAGVWAFDIDTVATDALAVEDYTSIAEAHGQFLGYTDTTGNVCHTFTVQGRYMLVAVKSGYITGFAKIAIEVPTLALKAPAVAWVNQLVTIKVYEQHILQPVVNAAVYAIDVNLLDKNNLDPQAYAVLAKDNGYLIGYTDGNGVVKTRFNKPAQYVLVAVKDGYVPGFAQITVRPMQATIVAQSSKPVQTTTVQQTPKPVKATTQTAISVKK